MKNSIGKQFWDGIITGNPVFVQLLGLTPALAITTSMADALAMGAAVTAVLLCSNLLISPVRRLIPKVAQLLTYMIIISGFVTAAELLIDAFFPDIGASLGIFVPLMAVNCLILARAEVFASKNPLIPSFIDGLATGIGFTVALLCISFVRELIGSGTLFSLNGEGGVRVFPEGYPGVSLVLLPAGGFITLGFLIALFNKLGQTFRKKAHSEDKSKEAAENE